MVLNRQAEEFNARQKRSNEYYATAGRGLGRIEDELRRLNTNMAVLIAAVEKLSQIAVQSRRSSTDQRMGDR